MAFQTSILREGEWVTETVNLQAALEASSIQREATTAHLNPPTCGVLSRTVVESPIVHWILPARLRSKAYNDIAFVGDHFVQISELQPDGQLHEVARKDDFGCRIRGAAVLGDSLQHGLDNDDDAAMIKSEDEDTLMQEPSESGDAFQDQALAPQLLVLMLESGGTVYICLRWEPESGLTFVFTKHESPVNLTYMGHLLSLNPTSRYMAAASPDGILVVHELRPRHEIDAQYRLNGSLDPVRSHRVRAFKGIIQKVQFLYPRTGDDSHIILILMVTKKERISAEPITRMVLYEWELGQDLNHVFAMENMGTRVPKEHRMPSLLIPLRFSTAFMIVSQLEIGIVKNSLSGVAVFETLPTNPPGRTRLHHGLAEPLWTAWSRPFRRKQYFEKTDIIYLAREDGAILHIEIDAPDLMLSVVNVGPLDANINTAFTTAYDIFADVLVIGGDSGPGGVWKLAPRTELERVSVLPNWSPVVDVATSARSSLSESNKYSSKPDMLFSASGRGMKGTLTQWRWGIQGRIGLELDPGEPTRRSWGFFMGRTPKAHGLYGLLALPDASGVLRFSEDLAQVDSLEADKTAFDLASRTLDAHQTDSGLIIQVTERCISLITASHNARHYLEDILPMENRTAENAFCGNDVVVLGTTSSLSAYQIHIIAINGMRTSLVQSWDVPGEVTCGSIFEVTGNTLVIVASAVDSVSWISVFSLDGKLITSQALNRKSNLVFLEDQSSQGQARDLCDFEPLTSICAVYASFDATIFVAGTRCGHLLTIRLCVKELQPISWKSEVMGVAPVDVFPMHGPFDGVTAALACVDNNLVMMTQFSETHLHFQSKNYVWLTDSNNPSMPSPRVHSAFSLGLSLSGHAGHTSIMVLADSGLLFADLSPHYALVPRCIPLHGTPTRVIYSHAWNCLVVAMLRGDKPTLEFIDVDTGKHIAVASDKDKNQLEFISGLGHPGDRIYGLSEWLYVKDGKTFAFLLVGTKDGRLLIISVNKLEARFTESNGPRLQYWTRYKKLFGEPIYSIVGDEDGIIFCVDRTIHWDVLDLTEKKLKGMKEYDLDSPATSLRVSRGKILALTTLHSLEVINHRTALDNDNNHNNNNDMVLQHTDGSARMTVHTIDIGTNKGFPSDSRWPVTMLSDTKGGIAGIWIPWNQHNKECEVVFESSLPKSVRRFVYANSRPPWVKVEGQPRYGVIASTDAGTDVLGVSLDGSLRHFTLIDVELWRLLSLTQILAQRSPYFKPTGNSISCSESRCSDEGLDLPPRLHPRLMHVDGDVLSQCLKHRMLEQIVGKGDELELFFNYLDRLDGGRWTKDFRYGIGQTEEEHKSAYFRLGYGVLAYLLSPVL
ncbi:hypothetical protein E4U30_004188 [Claviceps sp. LM220 group G6]|nr:hypothetical protein E4U30_004188 [Claviceps sp. LM220 group G6]KAG6096376.1 hypothetical protein E4U31_005470 [Claviceps sp. LM219 group G6]KAG6104160.1 hypothetical protein E4U14_005880 [Claviceps sp. LM454 group G7]